MVKKRSKRRDESGMAVDSTGGDGGGWQVGVPASAEPGLAREGDDGQEPAAMDETDISVARQSKALKVQMPGMKVKQGSGPKQGKRGQRTKAQKKRKALKLAKALSHADRKGVSHTRKVAATAVKKDLKKLWTTEKKAAPVVPDQ